MKRSLVAVLISLAIVAGTGGAAVGAAGGAAAQRMPDSSLHRLGWLAGCWEMRRGDRVTLEMWMPPAAGIMLGASRTVVSGAVRDTEVLRIEGRPSGLAYIALPSGQRETVFTAAALTDSGFTASNPANDFPQHVVYRRVGADSLMARIEGPARDGAVRAIDFPMRRVRCESAEPGDRPA